MFKSLSSLTQGWKRNKGFLLINITGLAIGLTVSILLLVLL
jgi:tetrahydromethanopterin S-methyltransferase subunit F